MFEINQRTCAKSWLVRAMNAEKSSRPTKLPQCHRKNFLCHIHSLMSFSMHVYRNESVPGAPALAVRRGAGRWGNRNTRRADWRDPAGLLAAFLQILVERP